MCLLPRKVLSTGNERWPQPKTPMPHESPAWFNLLGLVAGRRYCRIGASAPVMPCRAHSSARRLARRCAWTQFIDKENTSGPTWDSCALLKPVAE